MFICWIGACIPSKFIFFFHFLLAVWMKESEKCSVSATIYKARAQSSCISRWKVLYGNMFPSPAQMVSSWAESPTHQGSAMYTDSRWQLWLGCLTSGNSEWMFRFQFFYLGIHSRKQNMSIGACLDCKSSTKVYAFRILKCRAAVLWRTCRNK